jgi:hypothetical protein
MSAAIGISFLAIMVLVVPLVTGIVLIILARKRSPGHPACGKCGYDVSGSVGEVTQCPECGELFTEVGITPRVPKGRPVMMGVGIALIALVGTCFAGMMLMTATAATRTVAPPPAATAQPTMPEQPIEPTEPAPAPASR